MEIKKGYKQTEVGVIPKDWEVKKLGDLAELTSSKRIFENEYVSIGIPFYRGKEISLLINNTPLEDEYFISESRYEEIKRQFGAPKKGEILITAVGTLGNVYVIPNENKFYFKDGNLIWLKNIRNAIPEYLAIQIRNRKAEIISNSIGSSQKALTIIVLKNTSVPIPPTKAEQTAIANSLSDADALIHKLEALIAKKRNIKQGAMQELLTGKKRLPGFSGDWEVKKLGEIFSILAGGDLIKESFSLIKDDQYCYPIYSNSLTAKGLYGFSELYRYDGNCLTVTARGTIGVANARDHKFDAIGRVLVLKPIYKLNCFFVSEYLNNRVTFSVESTGVPQLTAPQISKHEITIPGFEEQIAIAQILSDMDAEIEQLEQKLEKYRLIKQGMMQELLTGKIRLNHD